MKKITMLSVILWATLTGCQKVDIGSNKNNTTNTTINNGTSDPSNPPPAVDSNLRVITRMNNKTMYDGETYQVGARTLVEFSWDQLPPNCNDATITVVISESKYGHKLYEASFHTQNHYYIAELPTDCFHYPYKVLVQWKVEPLTCSGKKPVEGKWYFVK